MLPTWIPPPFAWMDLNNAAGLGPDQVNQGFQPSVLLKSVSPQQEEALKSPLGSCADSGTSMSKSNATFIWIWKEDLGPVTDSPVQFVLNHSKRRPMSLVQEWLHTWNHILMCRCLMGLGSSWSPSLNLPLCSRVGCKSYLLDHHLLILIALM